MSLREEQLKQGDSLPLSIKRPIPVSARQIKSPRRRNEVRYKQDQIPAELEALIKQHNIENPVSATETDGNESAIEKANTDRPATTYDPDENE